MEELGPLGHVAVPPGQSHCEILLHTRGEWSRTPQPGREPDALQHGEGTNREEKAEEEAWGRPTSAPPFSSA